MRLSPRLELVPCLARKPTWTFCRHTHLARHAPVKKRMQFLRDNNREWMELEVQPLAIKCAGSGPRELLVHFTNTSYIRVQRSSLTLNLPPTRQGTAVFLIWLAVFSSACQPPILPSPSLFLPSMVKWAISTCTSSTNNTISPTFCAPRDSCLTLLFAVTRTRKERG